MRQILHHGRTIAGVVGFTTGWLGSAALVFLLAGCNTSAPAEVASQGKAKTNVGELLNERTIAAEVVVPANPPDQPEPATYATRPWRALSAIWFYYRSAELRDTETKGIAKIVEYAAQHPAVEIGINRPADASGVEPENDDVNRQRVMVIREALIQQGVAPLRIHAGAFEGPQASINRLVVVFIREGQ